MAKLSARERQAPEKLRSISIAVLLLVRRIGEAPEGVEGDEVGWSSL